MESLNILEEGKYYTISFDDPNSYIPNPKIIEIKVLIKLKNSIKLKLLESNKNEWYRITKEIRFFDEIPIKYFRKEKLEKLNESEN